MTLLVLGNGFDLAHHLPTQYSDFLDFVKAIKDDGKEEYSAFISQVQVSNKDLFSEIEELYKDNILLDYFLSIYEERCASGRNGWIDFESEISLIVQKLDDAKMDIISKISGPADSAELDKGIFQYLQPIIDPQRDNASKYFTHVFQPRFFDYQGEVILNVLNRLTRLLEIYLQEYVEKIDCKSRISDLDSFTIDHVLSFNYTDTYQKYYDPAGKANYCYIHGKAVDSNMEDCNLVLGIDEYLPNSRRDSDNQFIWFKKFYQRIYKKTGAEYLDWINHFCGFNDVYKKGKPSHMDILIYGHSLDVTDKDVLSKLILMKNTTTQIFYHDRKALAKQIGNLVKVIGEDNLIHMTGGKNRQIVFVQTQPAVIRGIC